MVLASSLSGTGYGIVVAVYVVLVLLAWLISPRDVYGRRRASGCLISLAIFFGLFVVAFAGWAAQHIF